MTRELIAYGLVVGVLIASAAWCLESLSRLLKLPIRWIWIGALAATVLSMVIAPGRHSRAVALDLSARATLPTAAAPAGASRLSLGVALDAGLTVIAGPVEAALSSAAHIPAATEPWLLAAWTALAALLIGVLTIGYARVWRAARAWPVTTVQGTRVRLTPRFGPAAVGLIAPEVVVPRWILGISPEQQRLAVSHEREHVRARDPLLLAIGCGAAVLTPWHPAIWWMLARLRLAVELDCDARVLRQRGASAHAYGNALLDLAGQCSGSLIGMPALAHGATHLERRLLAMTSRPSRFARLRGSALVALALTSIVAACEARLPTSAEVEHMDARAAERQLSMVGGMDSAAEYRVDGVVVTRQTALAIPASDIATIEVHGPESGGGGRSTVSIRTTRGVAGHDSAPRKVAFALTTDSGAARPGAPGMITMDYSPTNRPRSAKESFDGLIVIDGVMSNPSALAKLTPAEIESVEVLKGHAAQQLYRQPGAANGVIVVKTVHGTTK